VTSPDPKQIRDLQKEIDRTRRSLRKHSEALFAMAQQDLGEADARVQMETLVREFAELIKRHDIHPTLGHAVICTMALSTMTKWRPE